MARKGWCGVIFRGVEGLWQSGVGRGGSKVGFDTISDVSCGPQSPAGRNVQSRPVHALNQGNDCQILRSTAVSYLIDRMEGPNVSNRTCATCLPNQHLRTASVLGA